MENGYLAEDKVPQMVKKLYLLVLDALLFSF